MCIRDSRRGAPRMPPAMASAGGDRVVRVLGGAMRALGAGVEARGDAPVPNRRPSFQDASAYSIHFVAGIAVLAPWNALISAADYFQAAHPGRSVARLLTACYLAPTLICMVGLLGRHESTKPRARIVGGFTAYAVLMVILPLVEALSPAPLAAALAVAALVGVADGLSQPAVYGETALLPPAYTQAVVGGTAVSGVVTSLLRVVTRAALPSAAGGGRAAVVAFFATSAAECGVAAVLYGVALPRTSVWRRLSAEHAEARKGVATPEVELAPRAPAPGSDGSSSGGPLPLLEAGPPPRLLHPPPDRRRVAAHVWPTAAAMVAIYAVTIALFPGAFADQATRLGDWYFILVSLLFNAADLTGKMIPAIPWVAARTPQPKTLLVLALARAGFVPALIFAARTTSTTTAAAGVAVVSGALGVTNGYVTASCFMRASAGLHGRDAEDAGTVAVLALVIGLCVGSALSFLFLA